MSGEIVASRRARSASDRFLVWFAWARARWVAGSEQLFPKLPQGIVVMSTDGGITNLGEGVAERLVQGGPAFRAVKNPSFRS